MCVCVCVWLVQFNYLAHAEYSFKKPILFDLNYWSEVSSHTSSFRMEL